MDPNIKARPMKPKVRLVPSHTINCIGCAAWEPVGSKAGQNCNDVLHVRCHDNGKMMHIKLVGEHPSTR